MDLTLSLPGRRNSCTGAEGWPSRPSSAPWRPGTVDTATRSFFAGNDQLAADFVWRFLMQPFRQAEKLLNSQARVRTMPTRHRSKTARKPRRGRPAKITLETMVEIGEMIASGMTEKQACMMPDPPVNHASFRTARRRNPEFELPIKKAEVQ